MHLESAKRRASEWVCANDFPAALTEWRRPFRRVGSTLHQWPRYKKISVGFGLPTFALAGEYVYCVAVTAATHPSLMADEIGCIQGSAAIDLH